ncbi:hydrolase, partial [Mesorhizobium sp. M8A.F.Ca.ET.197.01.1.1]
ITADLSRDEQAALFFGNAARIYRLDAGSSPGLLPA